MVVRLFIRRSDNHTSFFLFFLALRYVLFCHWRSSSESCWLTPHAHHRPKRVSTCINRTLPIVPSFPPPFDAFPTYRSNLLSAFALYPYCEPRTEKITTYGFARVHNTGFVVYVVPCLVHTKRMSSHVTRKTCTTQKGWAVWNNWIRNLKPFEKKFEKKELI